VTVTLDDADSTRVRVRPVRLWGRIVDVDESGRVLCRGCWRLVDVVELGRPGNGHNASPWAELPSGALVPAEDDEQRWLSDGSTSW